MTRSTAPKPRPSGRGQRRRSESTLSVIRRVEGLTPFQWQVLAVTAAIPLGETRSYKWVAQQIGRPGAVRAVGQALKRNPYPLIIPCHRVIRQDGSLGGYAGGSGSRKAELLAMERQIALRIRQSTLRRKSKK